MADRPPLPPFDLGSALTKRRPPRTPGTPVTPSAYTVDSAWRNRDAFFTGRVPIDESQRRIFGPRPTGERGTEFPLSRRAIGGSYSPPRPVGHGDWLLPMLTPDVLPVRRDACGKPVRPADPLKSS